MENANSGGPSWRFFEEQASDGDGTTSRWWFKWCCHVRFFFFFPWIFQNFQICEVVIRYGIYIYTYYIYYYIIIIHTFVYIYICIHLDLFKELVVCVTSSVNIGSLEHDMEVSNIFVFRKREQGRGQGVLSYPYKNLRICIYSWYTQYIHLCISTYMIPSSTKRLYTSHVQWFYWTPLILMLKPYHLVKFHRDLIATSPQNAGLVREFPLFQGHLGWWMLVKYYILARYHDFLPLAFSSNVVNKPTSSWWGLQPGDVSCFW